MTPYFERDGITIYHGDYRDILPALPTAPLILTDPPYVIKHMDGRGIANTKEFYRDGALNGLMDFKLDEYAPMLSKACEHIIAFHSRDQILQYAQFCMTEFGTYDLHFWHKTNAIPFVFNTWKSDVEYIALGWRSKKHFPVQQHVKSKVFSSGIETGKLHPTQKPVAIALKYLRVLMPAVVIDPFMGSGTMLVAARELRLKAIGIDREEIYCETAAKRFEQNIMEFGVMEHG